MQIQPYLTYNGRCEEAIDFYCRALGARVQMLMRFSEAPEPPPPGAMPPGSGNKVMHASLRIGESDVSMSDGQCTGQAAFEGISLSITVPTVAEADRVFAALLDGGQVCMPQTQTFFSPRFGMVADRFGVRWMVYVPMPMA
jgi:PhnB protein